MSDIASGVGWVDGQIVNAAFLNAAVNNAVNQPGLIADKGAATSPSGADQLLLLQGGLLKRTTVSALNVAGAGVTSVGLTMPTGFTVSGINPIVATGTFGVAYSSQVASRFLASPAAASGVPTFRAITSTDIASAGSINIAAATVDWSLGRNFWKVLTGPVTFIFTNASDGMSIEIVVDANSQTYNFPNAGATNVRWKDGGAEPAQSVAGIDWYRFSVFNGAIYGAQLGINMV